MKNSHVIPPTTQSKDEKHQTSPKQSLEQQSKDEDIEPTTYK